MFRPRTLNVSGKNPVRVGICYLVSLLYSNYLFRCSWLFAKESKSILEDHCRKLLYYAEKIENAGDIISVDSKDQYFEERNVVEYFKCILVLSKKVLQKVEAAENKRIIDAAEELLGITNSIKECRSVGDLLTVFKVCTCRITYFTPPFELLHFPYNRATGRNR